MRSLPRWTRIVSPSPREITVAWMRSLTACAVVVSLKAMVTGVGIGVETVSSVERVSLVSDVGESDTAGGGEAAEHLNSVRVER